MLKISFNKSHFY